jgi:hypothetical protein
MRQCTRLALAARDQADVSKDTEERQLRAYVIAEFLNSLDNFVAGKKAESKVPAQNVGQTPVYDMGWIAGFFLGDYPFFAVNELPDCAVIQRLPDGFRALMGKSGNLGKIADRVFDEEEIKKVLSGKFAIALVGRICYEDIFREMHFTDYCFQWTGHGEIDPQTEGYKGLGPAEYCPQGNDADRTLQKAIELPEVPYHRF